MEGRVWTTQCANSGLRRLNRSNEIHAIAEGLYGEHAPQGNYEFELKHKVIIDRFGRYPHRNAILGRLSSEEEIEFLKHPGSGF